MIIRNLKEIQTMCGGFGLKEKYEDIEIKGVSTDSRNISSENLFIPLVGENFNGHKFIQDVIDKKIKAALWSRNESIPDIDFPFILVNDTTLALQELAKSYCKDIEPKIIGITGSNGKTSTKDILASLLGTQYKTHKTKGNFNNEIGSPLTLLEMDEDTEMAVIEMGMDGFGQIELLTNIAPPDAAILTNIGEAHLEGLKTKENIAKAKLEILKGLKKDKLFLYYGDDSMLREQVENMNSSHEIKTFGNKEFNDYQAEILFINEKGASFHLKKPEYPEMFLPMLGKHQVLNATAAIAIAEYFNISFEDIERGLENIDKTGMRNDLIKASGFSILDDSYKSNPASVLAALTTTYDIEGYDQKIVVLGDMLGLGDEEIDMHKEIGLKIREDKIDYVFTIGNLGQYIHETAKLNFPQDTVFHFSNKKDLVTKINEIIISNALVLVKASRSLAMEEVVEALKKDINLL